jgi:uncharacterized protein (TIGR04222 family)
MINPFDLPGPQFLAFYAVLAVAVFITYRLALRQAESGATPALPLGDPYQMAYLRGGATEAPRIAVLSLVDRDLLEIDGDKLVAHGSPSVEGLPPIESAILARCRSPATAQDVFAGFAVAAATAPYEARLAALHLLPDKATRVRRWLWLGVAAAILLAIGIVKINIALGRGRTNVGFLLILMVMAPLALLPAARRRRTALGDAVLKDLQGLFGRLRRRVAPAGEGGLTSDTMLLAAVFGLSALPSDGFYEVRRVFAKSVKSGGSNCGSSCGSSYGSSGCGSSGCGGGGGGGGGCGGCGSS